MELAAAIQHDKYCVGNMAVKLCAMCKNKEVNDFLDSLPVDQTVEIKEGMRMVDLHTCKVTNLSYYQSKRA